MLRAMLARRDFVALMALLAVPRALRGAAAPDLSSYAAVAERIRKAATGHDAAWQRLAQLTDRFPGRLAGSDALTGAIAWVTAEAKKDGFDVVRTERVMVPHWRRGAEHAEVVAPHRYPLAILGLGGSVGTGPAGIEAPLLVVDSYEALAKAGEAAAGKIVLFDVPWLDGPDQLASYRNVTRYRAGGASAAAKVGAVAALVRSAGPTTSRSPHTGMMIYDAAVKKIPAAAVSGEDADTLTRLFARGERPVVRLQMDAETLPDAESANVVAELRGKSSPDEIVVMGGHLDCWDVAPGATDDGGGVVATWEALRVLKTLGLAPRRTIRFVAFTNEENGLRGGTAYRDMHRDALARHVLAIESDTGVFAPSGFGFTGSMAARDTMRGILALLEPLKMTALAERADTPDLGPVAATGVPALSLLADMRRYFQVHHTTADTVDKIRPDELASAAAAIATVAYVVADLPEPLAR
jgi:carboxypeptidase Q